MKKFFSSLLMMMLLTIFSCTALADTGKIGTVKVIDYIGIENTNIKYEVTGYYNRSHLFKEYIYPGTTLYIEASETLSAFSVSLVPAQRQTYSGNGGCLTFAFYYMMDEATYEQVKYDDQNKYSSGSADSYAMGVHYVGYKVNIVDENNKPLNNFTISMDTIGWDEKYTTTSQTSSSKEPVYIDAMFNYLLGFNANRGYLPSGGDDQDEYGNLIGVFTESIYTDPDHPLIIKDPNNKEIAKIAPKSFSSYIAPRSSYDIVIDNSFFDISTDSNYNITIFSPDPNDDSAWDYPMLTVYIRKKNDINNYGAAVIYNEYEYTGKAITPSVKIQGLTLGTDYEIVSYANNTNIGTASVTVKGIGDYTGTRTLNFKIYVNKKYTFSSGNLKYEVTTTRYETNNHVKVIGGTSKKLTSITVPATVTLGGVKFKVTSIDKNAFKGYSKLTKVTIGKYVTSIGASAFYNCKNLSSVTISTGMKVINTKAFMNCKSLKKITIKSTVLTTVGKNALKGINKNCVIKVPKAKLPAYKKLLNGKGQPKTVKIKK